MNCSFLILFCFHCLIQALSCIRIPTGNSNTWPPTPCDALVPEYCTFPWPNDYYLLKDENYNPINLVLSTENFPVSNDGITTSPTDWNILDGFSPLPGIMAYFKDVSVDNCAPLWNISESVSNIDSPIVIMEANTGKRIAHWVELDHFSDDMNGNEMNRTLMIWPAYRLIDSQRYIVAIRNLYLNKTDKNGNMQLVNASYAFKALRDNITTNDESIELRRNYFNEYIFNILENNGVSRNNLQLAWDFTVMSTKQQTNRMITMRNDAFNRIDQKNGVEYRIIDITDDYSKSSARKIQGVMSVPWYLNYRNPNVKSRLVTEASDALTPIYQYMADVEFEMIIPRSVANGTLEGRYLQYGHGLFWNLHEIQQPYLQIEANKRGWILGCVDFLGLTSEDIPYALDVVSTNLTDFPMVPDRLHQGQLDALFLMKLWLSPQFLNDTRIWKYNNVTMKIDASKRNYYGNSDGGIMGSVYMSLTTDITHGVLGVMGFPFELLLPRSCDFKSFADIIKLRYDNDIDRIWIVSSFQLLWNRLSPSGYLPHISENVFDNDTPIHTVMMHYGLGDGEVSWITGEQMGRTLNASMFVSNVHEVGETLYGFHWVNDDTFVNTSKYGGSHVIQGWHYPVPIAPFTNTPANCSTNTHQYTRRQPDAQRAIHDFFTKQVWYNPCNSTCNGFIPPNVTGP